MKKSLPSVFAASCACAVPAFSATLASYTFEQSTSTLAPVEVASGYTASNMGRSTFVSPIGNFGNSSVASPPSTRAVFFTENPAGVFGDDFSTSAPNAGNASSVSYFTFTVTPGMGNTLNLTGLGFDYQFASDPDVRATFSLRSDVNGFADTNQIGYVNTVAGSSAYASSPVFDLTGAEYQGLTVPVEFRIYISDTSGAERGYRMDNILLTGVVPEPSVALLGALGALALLRRRR